MKNAKKENVAKKAKFEEERRQRNFLKIASHRGQSKNGKIS